MKKSKLDNLLCGLLFAVVLFVIGWMIICNQPSGYYVGTDVMQPDGTHYIWVEE